MSLQNKLALINQLTTDINDNNNNEITASDVRSMIQNIIDSYPNLIDDAEKLGLKAYNTGVSYQVGESCIESGVIYVALTTTTGTFTPGDWVAIGDSQKATGTTDDQFVNPTGNVSVDGGSTGITITNTPPDCRIDIFVDGHLYQCGNGDKTKPFYFSADGGTTAKTFANVVSGDTLYFNSVIAGWTLETTDPVSIQYEKIQ